MNQTERTPQLSDGLSSNDLRIVLLFGTPIQTDQIENPRIAQEEQEISIQTAPSSES